MRRLTQAEIQKYRFRIHTLNIKAQRAGNRFDLIDNAELDLLSPRSPIGWQIYESYSDEELLDILLKGQEAPDHKLGYHNICVIYRRYLTKRFGDEWSAKMKARTLVKQRKAEVRWPPDWPERVSMEPLLAEMKRRNRVVTPEDHQMFSRMCEISRRTGFPPEVRPFERKRLDELYTCRKALELMGIPYMNKAALRHMRQYWTAEREKAAKERRTFTVELSES